MAILSSVSQLCLAVFACCWCVVHPAPHIIGGGWNTDLVGGEGSRVDQNALKSAFSSRRAHRFHDDRATNINAVIESIVNDDNESDSTVDENRSDPSANTASGINLPPAPMSGLQTLKSVLRVKRQACPIPTTTGINISQLRLTLNSSHFLKANFTQSPRPTVPNGQPDACPVEDTNWWWPKTEVNLRSTCPWTYSEKDLGQNSYPRYILEAKCLCVKCVQSTTNECVNIRQDVMYFEQIGCQDGLALMLQKTVSVVVGCHCAHPPPQDDKSLSVTGSPGDDYDSNY